GPRAAENAKGSQPSRSRAPRHMLWRWRPGKSPLCSAVAGQVHLDLGQVDLALLLERGFRLGDLLPVAGVAAARPAAVHLELALALDARRDERQGVQPGDGDLLVAALADPVGPLLEPPQRPLD